MDGKSVVAAPLLVLLSLAAGTAQAQLNPDSVVRQVSREVERSTGIELVEQGGNGHDKCKGNGHHKDDGHGHQPGECDEDENPPSPEPTGPVGETVCAAPVDPESAYQRFTCGLAVDTEAYLAAVDSYSQSYAVEASEHLAAVAESGGIAVLEAIGDGANGLLVLPRPGNPPSPVVPGDPALVPAFALAYAETAVTFSRDYAFEAGGHADRVAQTGAAALLSALGNGGNGLIVIPRPGNPPSPVMPIALPIESPAVAAVTAYSANAYAYATDYAFDASGHADRVAQTGAGALLSALGNGGNGLIVIPRPGNPPSPVVPTSVEDLSGYVAANSVYLNTYAVDAQAHVTATAQAGAERVLSSAGDVANGLFQVPRPGNPPSPVVPITAVLEAVGAQR